MYWVNMILVTAVSRVPDPRVQLHRRQAQLRAGQGAGGPGGPEGIVVG